MTDTATVKIWEGYSDRLPAREPDFRHDLELHSGEPDYGPGFDRRPPSEPTEGADVWDWSDDIAFSSGPIEVHLDVDEPAWLFIHTNDSYHNPTDWSRAIEGGLVYGPDIESEKPYGCEIWGRIVMWAARRSP